MNVTELELCDRTRVRKIKPNAQSDVVDEYTEAYRCGLIVEPLDVFQERGTERYLVADGEHRLLALQRAKVAKIAVRLHDGDEVAALDFAIGCNHAHGVRRTKADKYHAFERIMETSLKGKYRTDTELSEKIGVHKNTIANYKVQWRNSESGDKSTSRKKEKARETAEQHTPKDLAPRKELNGKKHDVEPAPKAVKAETAKAADDGWSKQDDRDSVDAFAEWEKFAKSFRGKTRNAQIHVSSTLAKSARDLFQ